jgi:thiamine biosynthesis lipoprotein
VQRFAIEAMATRFEVVLPGAGAALGELVLHEIADWHQRLNRFAPDSWLAHVNRTAASSPVRCDEDVWALLLDAHAVWRASGGAFDITRGRGHALVLDAGTRTVRFDDPAMALDLGGIAKGHALDCCARLLREYGITSAFLHGGTSSGLAIGLDPTTGDPWRVDFGTSSPRDFGTPGLRDFAFSVSDASSQPTPHIVDPRSGEMITRETAARVMVTGPSARLCEAWSTAAVVLGDIQVGSPGHRVQVSRGHTVHWSPGTKR